MPPVYLGISLGNKHKDAMEKKRRRLARSKTLYLSPGGKLTIVKPVLDSTP